jgi:hypothetical protein
VHEQERRNVHRLEDAADVGLVPHIAQPVGHIRCARVPGVHRLEAPLLRHQDVAPRLLLLEARLGIGIGAPQFQIVVLELPFVIRDTPGVIRSPAEARHGLVPHERSRESRAHGRQQRMDGSTREEAEEHRPPRRGRSQNGQQIGDARLEVRQLHVPTRDTNATMIVNDDPSEGSQRSEQRAERGILPDHVDVPRPVGLEDDVDRSIAVHAIPDVGTVFRPGVTEGRGIPHVSEPCSLGRTTASMELVRRAGVRSLRDGEKTDHDEDAPERPRGRRRPREPSSPSRGAGRGRGVPRR